MIVRNSEGGTYLKYQAPKTVLCIHDLSALGRCSMAVIAPVLSAMGHQAVALPTALLSAHTGGLGDPAVQDCTEFGPKVLRHYQELGISFDCIYSGYLANTENQKLVEQAYEIWPDALKIADPVMGDHGRLYKGMEEMLPGMRRICGRADVILPNLTEACLLLDKPYPEEEMTEEQKKALSDALSAYYPQSLVTGIPAGRDLECMGCGRQDFVVRRPHLEPNYPGTGDLFGAVMTGALLRGNALSAATDAAAGFVLDSIRHTDPTADPALGVWFEPLLYRLSGGDV